MTAERGQDPPTSGDRPQALVGWGTRGSEAPPRGAISGCAVRFGWAALGWLVGIWVSIALVPWASLEHPFGPLPDWLYIVTALLPFVGAVAVGARGPAIVGSLAGRSLLIAVALAPFASFAILMALPETWAQQLGPRGASGAERIGGLQT